METKQSRTHFFASANFVELVGTFGLVLFSSGLVCINQTTTLAGQSSSAPLTLQQPGVFGVALGQGLILAALLALTVPVSAGFLNPAITLMLWVFNRVETGRATGLICAQFIGATLAALCLRYTFDNSLLQEAHFGAPHINNLAYPAAGQSAHIACTFIELLLTFFLVFAIFGMAEKDSLRLGIVAGMIATACSLFGSPLTGPALNPARWLGPTLVASFSSTDNTYRPWSDTLVYLAGPIIGALLGGWFVFWVYRPAVEQKK